MALWYFLTKIITIVLAQHVSIKSIADFPKFHWRILIVMKIALILFVPIFRKESREK